MEYLLLNYNTTAHVHPVMALLSAVFVSKARIWIIHLRYILK